MNFNLEKTYNYLAALICVSIPFMTYAKAFVNICMVCLFLIMVVSYNKDKVINIVNQNFFKAFTIFLIFIVIYSLFNGSFFDDFAESRKIAQRNFNTHNQYIDIILSFGFIGLILFTLFLREVVRITYKNIYSLNLILSLILFLVIENLFHRQLGSFILALTIVIAAYIINLQNEKDTSS